MTVVITKRCAEDSVSTENIAKWLARPLKPISLTEVPDPVATVGTTIGDVRPENQDRAVVARFTSVRRPKESFLCFALCDGMGGMADGARCAEIALASFLIRLTHGLRETSSKTVRTAALAANAEVYRQYRERGGTTLVAIVFFPGSEAAVSVGDSRIYAANARKELKQISIDDTIAGELDKLNGVRASRSRWDTFASQLAQFIGIGEGMEPRLYPVSGDVTYLLTSDGIHSMSHDTLEQIVAAGGTSQVIVSRLLQVSRWCGGSDNASVICIPPFRPTWSSPPPWSNGEWLEIWDASGKLDCPMSLVPSDSGQIGQGKQLDQTGAKPKRSRKPASRVSRKDAGPTKDTGQPPSTQQSLKIEIVDEKPRDTEPGIVQPEDSVPKESGGATEHRGTKRD